MIKVVIDTSVLVSAAMKAHGAEAAVLDFIAAGKLVWCISPPIVQEYQGVLARPKFICLDRVRVQRVLASLERATVVVPTVTRTVSPDDSDNRFLECAQRSRERSTWLRVTPAISRLNGKARVS